MGRVTPKSEVSTPVMARSRLPHDVLAQYNGKTREDLIEMVVDLKKELDGQGKKIVDLEDYIDNLDDAQSTAQLQNWSCLHGSTYRQLKKKNEEYINQEVLHLCIRCWPLRKGQTLSKNIESKYAA